MYYCYKCGVEIVFEVKVGTKVGRQDACENCGTYLHVCKNCKFYDESLSIWCTEPMARFVRDPEEANFCHFYTFADRVKPDAKAALEARMKLNRAFGGGDVDTRDPLEKAKAAFGSDEHAPRTADEAREKLSKVFDDANFSQTKDEAKRKLEDLFRKK